MQYIVLTLILFFVFRYFYKKHQKKPVEPFPKEWEPLLNEHVLFYTQLNTSQKKNFRQRMMLFLSETKLEAVHFTLEDLDSVLVAASAVIPVFGFKNWSYENLNTVIIYPDYFNHDLAFDKESDFRNIAGMVGTGIYNNKMILSRKALHFGFSNKTDKKNTAIHEFVHLLDKNDGATDGIPENLLKHEYSIPWLNLIHKKMEAINNDESDIRQYGGTSQTEFFAVASEYFFSRPDLMKRKHPELHRMLSLIFRK